MRIAPLAGALAAATTAVLVAAAGCSSGIQTVRPAERPPLETRTVTPIPDVSPRAARLWREAIVVDAHNDMPTKVLDERYDPDARHGAGYGPGEGHTDLPRLVQSGITAVWLSAWVDAPYARTTPDSSYERAMLYVDSIRAFAGRHPDRVLFATTAADVERAKREGKVAVLIGVEGGHAIEGSLDNLRALYGRGARYLTLTWNNGTEWAGSSVGVDGTRTEGLTDFGRDVVREMNRLGMLVDVSHVSERTFFDVLATSAHPVIASHSSARALNDHPRNLSDDQLRAIARAGGVVNVNFFSRFIDPAHLAAWERSEAELRALGDSLTASGADSAAVRARLEARGRELAARLPETPFSVLIDHFDHVAKVAGVDHVGIGSDFDGVSALPAGMEDVTRLPRLAQALLDRGYSEADVKKILGGNMMRVMRDVLGEQGRAGN
jgi:membrane dipeptidase